MPTQLTIEVFNSSGETQEFQIFNAIPTISTSGAYMNTWAQAPGINTGSDKATFNITENFYAVCGKAPSAIAPGLEISTFNQNAVNLGVESTPGSNYRVDVPKGEAPIFSPNTDEADADVDGGFRINTLHEVWTLADDPNGFVGMGRDDPSSGGSGGVVPVFVWPPAPNQQYNITPTQMYYISYSYTMGGLAASVSDLGTVSTINFTGRKETKASVTLLSDFTFSEPVYT